MFNIKKINIGIIFLRFNSLRLKHKLVINEEIFVIEINTTIPNIMNRYSCCTLTPLISFTHVLSPIKNETKLIPVYTINILNFFINL